MWNRALHLVRVTVCGCLLLAVAGCGGGGSDAGPAGGSGDGFLGTYHAVFFEGLSGDDQHCRAGWGAFIADPIVGLVEGSTDQNEYVPPVPPSGSDIVGPVSFGPAPFWLRDDEDLTIEDAAWFEGGASADGRVAGLAAGGAGDDPALLLLLRREGSFTLASLTGDYHLFLFGHDSGADAGVAYRGTASFDGSGAGSMTVEERNTDGVLGGPLTPIAVTYALSAQGALTLTFGTGVFEGGLLAGGDLAFLGGSNDAASVSRGLIVLIRESTAADASLFAGTYDRVSIARRAGTGWSSVNEEITGSGAGTWARTGGFLNGDGVIIVRPLSAPMAHTVDPDGTWLAGDTHGAVSPDGRFAAWMIFGVGVIPSLSFLVR